MTFFEDFCYVEFCVEINFENLKEIYYCRKHEQGGNIEDSYSHKNLL